MYIGASREKKRGEEEGAVTFFRGSGGTGWGGAALGWVHGRPELRGLGDKRRMVQETLLHEPLGDRCHANLSPDRESLMNL